jgi:hypothetical protein
MLAKTPEDALYMLAKTPEDAFYMLAKQNAQSVNACTQGSQ